MTKDNIVKINTVDRPKEVSLIDALETVVDEFAYGGGMTRAEVLGCLDYVSKSFFAREFMYHD